MTIFLFALVSYLRPLPPVNIQYNDVYRRTKLRIRLPRKFLLMRSSRRSAKKLPNLRGTKSSNAQSLAISRLKIFHCSVLTLRFFKVHVLMFLESPLLIVFVVIAKMCRCSLRPDTLRKAMMNEENKMMLHEEQLVFLAITVIKTIISVQILFQMSYKGMACLQKIKITPKVIRSVHNC